MGCVLLVSLGYMTLRQTIIDQPFTPALSSESNCGDSSATIISPAEGEEISGQFSIIGTMENRSVKDFSVEIASLDATPLQWIPVPRKEPTTQSIFRGPLSDAFSLDTQSDKNFAVRLNVTLLDGTVVFPCEIHFSRKIL
jgi:hypothetical protein